MTKPSGTRARLSLVERMEELDPALNQGRNKHHNPQRDLDIVLTLLLVIGPVFLVIGGIALFCAPVGGGK